MIFGGTSTRILESSPTNVLRIIYRKITNKNDIRNLQKDLDTQGEWAVENGVKINPGKERQ